MPLNLTIKHGSIKIGSKENQLTTVGPQFQIGKRAFCVCQCECGNFTAVRIQQFKRGSTKSCGCWRIQIALRMGKGNTRHGMDGTPLYIVWHNLKSRCNNPNEDSYEHYGERGITYCPEWEQFEPFMEWALNNGYRSGLQIDRENNNGNYEPGNCRFVTPKKNSNNKRNTVYVTAFGETKPLSEWADDLRCKVGRIQLWGRLNSKKWTPEAAITTPSLPRGKLRRKAFYD